MAEPAPRRVVALVGSAGAVPIILQQVAGLDFRGQSALFVMYHRLGQQPFDMAGHARHSAFQVAPAADGEPVVANRVYHPPGTHDVEVRGGVVRVRPSAGRPHPNIDRLLTSLATAYGPGLTAGLLSGLGRDGVAGMRAVRAAGGETLVQAPAWADFPQLPEAALADHPAHTALPTPALLERLAAALRGDGGTLGLPARRAASLP